MRYVVRFFDGKITVEEVVETPSARVALSVAKGLLDQLNVEMGYKDYMTFIIKAVTPIIPSDFY